MRQFRVVLLLGVILLALCAILIVVFDLLPAPLQAPRITQIEPSNGANEIHPSSPITLTFSVAMDRRQTQKSVQFEPPIAGEMTWSDDRTLLFTPRSTLPISTTVNVTVSQNARSWLQRPLANPVVSQFTTLSRPYLVSSTPALDAQFIYVPDRVTINFNRAMDGSLVADGLFIDPPLTRVLYRTVDKTLTIWGFFQAGTRYQIILPGFVPDREYGIPLERDYIWSFTASSQYPNFSILNRGRVLNLPANQPVTIPTQFTNVSRLDVAVYPITRQEFDTNATLPFEAWYGFHPSVPAPGTQSVTTNAVLDTYQQLNVPLGALDSGAYYLKITTPEGVSDSQLLLIE